MFLVSCEANWALLQQSLSYITEFITGCNKVLPHFNTSVAEVTGLVSFSVVVPFCYSGDGKYQRAAGV